MSLSIYVCLWHCKQASSLGIPNKILNIIISFYDCKEVAQWCNVMNSTKQGCVISSVLFALGDAKLYIWWYRHSCQVTISHNWLSLQPQFKEKNAFANQHHLWSFSNDTTKSLKKAQELVDYFSDVSKAFGLNINIKKTEVIYQPTLNLKQIRGVKQRPPTHKFTGKGKSLKYKS